MKIKNISQQDLNLSVTKLNGEKIIVNMKPNQVLYSENETDINKQILIYEKKKLISVIRDIEKPDFVNYYKSFFESGTFVPNYKSPIIDLDDEDDDLDESIDNLDTVEITMSIDSDDEELDSDMPAEKKGRGRPKGTTKTPEKNNEPKKGRGRPKGTIKTPNQIEESSEPKKGRGRPKGSIKVEKKTIIQIDIENNTSKKRGRPRKLQLAN